MKDCIISPTSKCRIQDHVLFDRYKPEKKSFARVFIDLKI